jgi:hypothetical protein
MQQEGKVLQEQKWDYVRSGHTYIPSLNGRMKTGTNEDR